MKRPFIWMIGILFFLFFLFRLFFGEVQDKKYESLALKTGETLSVTAEGTLKKFEKKPGIYYLYLHSVHVSLPSEQKRISYSDLLVVTKSFQENSFDPGNLLYITGRIESFHIPENPGGFDEKAYFKEKNIFYKINASSIVVKEKKKSIFLCMVWKAKKMLESVYHECLSEEDAGVVSAMLLGEKGTLDLKIKELYQTSGIGHLLSISGLHISILCMALYRFLLKISVPDRICFPIVVFFLYVYGQMTGFSISTSRAVIMMVLYLLSRQIGRSYDPLTAMGVSAVIILLQKPYALFSSSFLLSYSAMGGVVILFPAIQGMIYGSVWEQEERKRKEKRFQKECMANSAFPSLWKGFFSLKRLIISSFLLNISILTATFPVAAWFFYEIPTYSILLNLIVIPLSGFLVILSALGGILGIFFLPLSKKILFIVHLLLKLYSFSCTFFSKMPEPVQILGRPGRLQIIVYLFCLAFLVYWCRFAVLYQKHIPFWKKCCLFLVLVIAFSSLLYRPKIKGIHYTMLDVGQGDGMVIQTETGHTILIDGGSTSVAEVGKYRILPFLKYNGIRKLDYMIMTHEDEDHVSGQLELLKGNRTQGIRIGTYLLPEPSERSVGKNYQLVKKAAKKAGVSIRYIHKGDLLSLGRMKLICLHPEKGFKAESANAYSTTLKLTYGTFSMLLTGDLEKNGEKAVFSAMEGETKNQITILKAAHHGSKNSSSMELLQLWKPSLTMISCGRKNRYGHPHKELLERLKAVRSKVLRTDQRGAILLESDGEKWKVRTWCKE